MDAFWKRVQAIKVLYPSVVSNDGDKGYDDSGNEVSMNETNIANKITEQDTARDNAATKLTNDKASGIAKLKADTWSPLSADEVTALFGE
tara:strand:+ start:1032 stop:1301 length:270 start_codon:yes stop_codon:yes gene_type:complete